MDDFVIVIPVAIDNTKRRRNLEFVKNYYQNFNTIFTNSKNIDYFHKSKICNDVYKLHKDKIIFMCDVDCIIPLQNLKIAYDIIKNNPKTLVYPFDEIRYIDPTEYHSLFEDYNNYKIIKIINGFKKEFTLQNLIDYILDEKKLSNQLHYNFFENNYKKPLGYGFVFSCNEYYSIGLDNEYILDYNFEDLERFERARKMKFNIVHLNSIAYHLDHSEGKIGAKNRKNKKFISQNAYEYYKIVNLNKEELEAYIETWQWIKN